MLPSPSALSGHLPHMTGEERVELLGDVPGAVQEAVARGVAGLAVLGEGIDGLAVVGPLLQAIVAREDVRRHKPNPDPFLAAAAALGIEPGCCLALEDSHNGVRAAHAAGMMTVMVPDLLEPTDEMRDKCLAIAESLHHVRELIDQAAAVAS